MYIKTVIKLFEMIIKLCEMIIKLHEKPCILLRITWGTFVG